MFVTIPLHILGACGSILKRSIPSQTKLLNPLNVASVNCLISDLRLPILIFFLYRISTGCKQKNMFLKQLPTIHFWSASIRVFKRPLAFFSSSNLCVVAILCSICNDNDDCPRSTPDSTRRKSAWLSTSCMKEVLTLYINLSKAVAPCRAVSMGSIGSWEPIIF